jgi:hypothetical protein
MHKIVHREAQPDVLFALPGPIPALVESVIHDSITGEPVTVLELPITAESWYRIGELATDPALALQRRAQAVRLDRLACAFCGEVGRLVAEEWPTDESGKWPAFGDKCPRCRAKLEDSGYVISS